MLALSTTGLSKRFGALPAIDSIDLDVAANERLAILGPSGAGKTTLLRVLAGLEKVDQGTTVIHGEDVTALPPHRRGLAFVSQDYALYPQLDVRQNLETAVSSLGLGRSILKSRIDEALDWFQISELERRRPAQLSGGQAQRVALAKAIVRRPRLLLLDEPLSQIDCVLRETLRQLISDAVDRYRMTLIMVTHDPIDAMRLATQLAIMDRGRVVQVGSPATVYQAPTSRISAELLGPFGINWLKLDELSMDSRASLQAAGVSSLPEKTIGFRPEDVQCCSVEECVSQEDTLILLGEIKSVHRLGFAELAIANSNGKQIKCLGNRIPARGSKVQLIVPRDRWHVFDAE